jgi:hypothetical protein
MEDTQVQLLTEQLSRFKDSIDAHLKHIEADLDHHQILEEEKLINMRADMAQIRKTLDDHETRIRTAIDAVTSLKTSTSIMQAGQAALTLVAAAIAAWLGGMGR